jgi:signal transduction histidine kinase
MFLAVGPYIYYRRVSRLEREKKTQQVFAKSLIESQERERKRIAAELHDSLGQNLLVIQNNTLLALDAPAGTADVRDRLNDISTVTTQTISDVREIALNLRPYHLDKLGLATSIAANIRRISESSKISFTSDIGVIDHLFSMEDQSHIYRIIQEGLNNIVKHSHATEASVAIQRHDNTVRIVIKDNGHGLPADRIDQDGADRPPQGFGLLGIGERVRILNGREEVLTAPGKGTTISIELPCGASLDG